MKKIIHFLAYGFGSGLSPIMPGTCGTIVAIPIYLLLSSLSIGYYLLAVILLLLIGIWLCHITARDLKQNDPPKVVWDEIVGYLITMIGAPVNLYWIVAGFILFRLFDIWKPWPIRWIDDNIHNGFGIMLDDVLAAIYALILLQFIVLIIG